MRALLTIGGILLSAIAISAQAMPTAQDLAVRIQARYETVRDFTADFTLTQTSGLMGRSAVDKGTVKVRKPGRMNWTFRTGSQSQVVADGTTIYSYFPKDKYVQVPPMPKDDQASTALLLLTGRGNITRDFTPSLATAQPPGEWHLTLTPKARQADFATLTLAVDRTTLQLRGLVVVDDQGGHQTFRFSGFKENQGVRDADFVFKIPAGVEIRR